MRGYNGNIYVRLNSWIYRCDNHSIGVDGFDK